MSLCLSYNIDEWKSEVYEFLCRRTSPLSVFERNALRPEHQKLRDECCSQMCTSAAQGLLTSCSYYDDDETTRECLTARITRARVFFDFLHNNTPTSLETLPHLTTDAMISGLCEFCMPEIIEASTAWDAIVSDCVERMLQLPQVVEPEAPPVPQPFYHSHTILSSDVAQFVSSETLTSIAVEIQPGRTTEPEVAPATVNYVSVDGAPEGADGRDVEQPVQYDAPFFTNQRWKEAFGDCSTSLEKDAGEIEIPSKSTVVPAGGDEVEKLPQTREPSPTPLSEGGYSFC